VTNILSLFTVCREFILMKGLRLEVVFIDTFCHRIFERSQ